MSPVVKSFLRHLLGTILTAFGAVLVSPAELTLKVAGITIAAAVIPVVVKYIDPDEPDFGRGAV